MLDEYPIMQVPHENRAGNRVPRRPCVFKEVLETRDQQLVVEILNGVQAEAAGNFDLRSPFASLLKPDNKCSAYRQALHSL